MAASRAILFLPILVPVNLAIIAHVTGLRLRSLWPARARRRSSPAVAAIASERALRATGIVDGLAPFPALLLVGGVSALSALLVLLSLEPPVREWLRRLGAQGRAALRGRRLAPVASGRKADRLMPPRRSFGNALKWAMVMNSGTRGIATAVTFLLAALLGPGDFGLVAVALIYIAFVRMLLEQGFIPRSSSASSSTPSTSTPPSGSTSPGA